MQDNHIDKTLLAVATTDGQVEITPPVPLFDLPPSVVLPLPTDLSFFDVAEDGRFLMLMRGDGTETTGAPATPRINFVLNWFEELKERVPTGR